MQTRSRLSKYIVWAALPAFAALWFTGTYTSFVVLYGSILALLNVPDEPMWIRILIPLGVAVMVLNVLVDGFRPTPYSEWFAEKGIPQWFKTTDYVVAVVLAIPVVGYAFVVAYEQYHVTDNGS